VNARKRDMDGLSRARGVYLGLVEIIEEAAQDVRLNRLDGDNGLAELESALRGALRDVWIAQRVRKAGMNPRQIAIARFGHTHLPDPRWTTGELMEQAERLLSERARLREVFATTEEAI